MQTPNPEQSAPQPLTGEELAKVKHRIEVAAQQWQDFHMGIETVIPASMNRHIYQTDIPRLLATIDQAQEQVRVLGDVVESMAIAWHKVRGHDAGYTFEECPMPDCVAAQGILANTTPAPQQGEEG